MQMDYGDRLLLPPHILTLSLSQYRAVLGECRIPAVCICFEVAPIVNTIDFRGSISSNEYIKLVLVIMRFADISYTIRARTWRDYSFPVHNASALSFQYPPES